MWGLAARNRQRDNDSYLSGLEPGLSCCYSSLVVIVNVLHDLYCRAKGNNSPANP